MTMASPTGQARPVLRAREQRVAVCVNRLFHHASKSDSDGIKTGGDAGSDRYLLIPLFYYFHCIDEYLKCRQEKQTYQDKMREYAITKRVWVHCTSQGRTWTFDTAAGSSCEV